jgi:hypothetical protein
MNASILLNLYPHAWRARYEREFRAMLDDRPLSATETLDILLGAVDAHLRPQLHPGGDQDLSPATAQPPARREAIDSIFFAHLALFVAVMSLLALVNVFFTPGNWWALYPFWAWGTILATHAGVVFQWKGLFGAHLAFFTGFNAGLVTINITQGGPPWSLWPLLVTGIFVVAHALVAIRGASLIRAHVVATALAAGVLVLVAIATGFDAFADVLVGALPLGILLAAHWLMRNRGWSLLRAHAFVYAAVLAVLLVENLVSEPGELWVQYPFVFWTVLLAGHALVELRLRRGTGGDWESVMLAELGARGEPDRQRRLVRTLWVHAYAFLIVAVGFVLLNVVTGGGPWAAWPIGAWYVLLAFHAGYVLAPRRWIGSLLFGWVAASFGLIAIDRFVGGGNAWWYWPVMWSSVALALVLGAIWTRDRPWVGMHVLGGLALAAALIITDLVTGPPQWWFYPVAVIVVTWFLYFAMTLNLPKILATPSGRDR